MASQPKRLPHTPLSYSEMIARQSAVISEHDHDGGSQYSLIRSVTPNSRITFRRVDYASSQLYNDQNNNLSNSHSSSSNSHNHSSEQSTAPVSRTDNTTRNNINPARQGNTRRSRRQASTILQSYPTVHSHGEDHTIQETPSTMSEAGQPGRMAYAAVAKAAAAPSPSTSVEASSSVAMPTKQTTQHRPVISSEDTAAGATTTLAQADAAAEPRSPKNTAHVWLNSLFPFHSPIPASASLEEANQIVKDRLTSPSHSCRRHGNGLLIALDKALKKNDDDVQRRPEMNSDNGSDNAFRRTINVHNMNDWPMPGDSSRAKDRSRPSAAAAAAPPPPPPPPAARANSDHLELLRAAVETAAREGIARHNLQKSPDKARSTSTPKTEDKEESKSSIDHKNTVDVESRRLPSVHRQSRPFLHDHAHCQNWTRTPVPPFEARLIARFWPNGLVSTTELARRPPRNYSPALANRQSLEGTRSSCEGPLDLSANLRGGALQMNQMPDRQNYRSSTSSTSSYNYLPSVSSLDCRQGTQQVSWSNSHSWVADGEKERAHWVKIQNSMYHAGLLSSPFVPSNFSEYVDQRVDETIQRLEDAKEKLKLKQIEYNSLRSNLLAGDEVPVGETSFGQNNNEESVDNAPRAFATGRNIWNARSGSTNEIP